MAVTMKSEYMKARLLFLPGASGNTKFWIPVADKLNFAGEKIFMGWPGFGETPPDPDINGIDGLVSLVLQKIDRPTVLVAQSMGGAIAIKTALEKPDLVTGLVLTATSGGVDMSGIEVEDWRPGFHINNPTFPDWFESYAENLTERLPEIKKPALLLWGDSDQVSPVTVGQRLKSYLPNARLEIVAGGDHDLAMTHAAIVAPLIDKFLDGR